MDCEIIITKKKLQLLVKLHYLIICIIINIYKYFLNYIYNKKLL